MKKILIVLTLFCLTAAANAQEQTFFSGTVHHGGYGAPVVKFGNVYDHSAVFAGGVGGWIVNHSFILGGGGYGLANRIKADAQLKSVNNLEKDTRLEFGYGGVLLGFVSNSDNLIHFTVSSLIGAGHIGLTDNMYDRDNDEDGNRVNSSTLFVIEPEVAAELNLTSFCRLNIGASYRVVTGVDVPGLKNSDFSGPNANVTLKFGSF